MTKDESVQGCLEQWEFLARTGTKCKYDYRAAKNLRSFCFFCEYTKVDNLSLNCETCPGINYWTEGNIANREGHCLDARPGNKQTSLYTYWQYAQSINERKLWASRIVWMIWLIQVDIKNDKV